MESLLKYISDFFIPHGKMKFHPPITNTPLKYFYIYLWHKLSTGRWVSRIITQPKGHKGPPLVFGWKKKCWKIKQFFRFFKKGSFGLGYIDWFSGLIYFMVFCWLRLTTGSRWHSSSETSSESWKLRRAATRLTSPSSSSPHRASIFRGHLVYVSSSVPETFVSISYLRWPCWLNIIFSSLRRENSVLQRLATRPWSHSCMWYSWG